MNAAELQVYLIQRVTELATNCALALHEADQLSAERRVWIGKNLKDLASLIASVSPEEPAPICERLESAGEMIAHG